MHECSSHDLSEKSVKTDSKTFLSQMKCETQISAQVLKVILYEGCKIFF